MRLKHAWILSVSVLALGAGGALAADVDAGAAEALAKQSGCLTCHGVSQKKAAPSYKDIAAKLKGQADAEQKLYVHLTTQPKVKFFGKEQSHSSLKTRDEAQIRNVIHWILSR